MAYYDLYPERPEDVFSSSDWKQDSEQQSASTSSFTSNGQSTAQLVGKIPANKKRDFVRKVLGYHETDYSGSPMPRDYRLYRSNAKAHPEFGPLFRATSVSFADYCPTGEATGAETPPLVPFDFAAASPVQLQALRPRLSGQDFGGGAAVGNDVDFLTISDKFTRYKFSKAVVGYSQMNYRIVEDSALTIINVPVVGGGTLPFYDESYRYTRWLTAPAVDVIQLEGGDKTQLYWAETAAGGPVVGKPFPSPLGYLNPTAMITLEWYLVPNNYLFDLDEYPRKLLSILGKINQTEFQKYPAGTLLLLGFELNQQTWPIYATNDYITMWNVKFHFKNQDAPRGKVWTGSPSDEPRGFRVFRSQDGLSYWAKRANGNELYEQAEFRKLFEHVDFPSL